MTAALSPRPPVRRRAAAPAAAGERRRPIYVESRIRAPIDRVWDATQDPGSHQRWDLRFGAITYLPRADGEPQRFTYATTVFPGVTVAGTGEALGDRDRPDGTRWSGLRFWAADRRSIIDAGAGYWRYVPTADGVRFLTRYDYRPRWGGVGAVVDRWAFRPAFGWATAWSFDRLRLWLEEGVPPERARNRAIAHAAAVAGLSGLGVRSAVGGRRAARSPGSERLRCAAVVLLAAVAVGTARGRPSGRRPLRRPPDRQPAVGHLP
jgi:hypothetical protein